MKVASSWPYLLTLSAAKLPNRLHSSNTTSWRLKRRANNNVCTSDVCTNDMCTSDVCTNDVCTSDMCTSDVCTSNVCTSDVCTNDVCTGDVCTSDVCTGDVCTSDVCTGDVCTSDVCISDVSTSDVCTTDVFTHLAIESTCSFIFALDTEQQRYKSLLLYTYSLDSGKCERPLREVHAHRRCGAQGWPANDVAS